MVATPSGILTTRLTELDGLRAVALFPMLLFHLRVPGFGLGWIGLTLFFVISGFLITGILLDTRHSPHYFRNFYIRRALRIFPIYYLLLAAVITWGVLSDVDIADAWYYAVYLQNIKLASGDWVAHFPHLFTHTWSLAVEEQFYLFWPLLIWITNRQVLAWVLAVLFFAALAWRFYAQAASMVSGLYFMLPLSQIDGLAAGAALALAVRSGPEAVLLLRRSAAVILGVSALAFLAIVWTIGYANFWLPSRWTPVGVSPLLNTALTAFFAMVVFMAIDRFKGLSSVLRARPLRHIGTISYGLYLYHYPVYAGVDALVAKLSLEVPVGPLNIAKLGLSYVIALASWHLLERPLLGLKERWAKQRPDVVVEGSR